MPLPLGGGLVLNLPVGSDDVAMDGLVLDDDQRQKVEQMRRNENFKIIYVERIRLIFDIKSL